MAVHGPDHAAYWPDAADRMEAARPWANPAKRRALAVWAGLLLAALGAILGWAVEAVRTSFVTGDFTTGLAPATVMTLAIAALAIWTDRLLFKGSRPAFALPGEPYDERQAGLAAGASRPARALDALGVLVVAGLGLAGAPAGYIAGVALAVLALVMSGPQLVLVWTLDRAEFDFDDLLDGGEEADGEDDA